MGHIADAQADLCSEPAQVKDTMGQLSQSLEQLPKPAALLPAFQPAHVSLAPSGNWSGSRAGCFPFERIDGVLPH